MKSHPLPPQFLVSQNNPCGLDGLDFVEFVSNEPAKLDALFKGFGFSKTRRHQSKPIDLYQQPDIAVLVNRPVKWDPVKEVIVYLFRELRQHLESKLYRHQ